MNFEVIKVKSKQITSHRTINVSFDFSDWEKIRDFSESIDTCPSSFIRGLVLSYLDSLDSFNKKEEEENV